jgi:oligopeptide/dipeptide ABC transporter ATP-binding protein
VSEQPLLEISGLSVTMPARHGPPAKVLEGLDLRVGRGEAVGLVGESGCGKTTTLLSVLRLLPRGAQITAGSITFDGIDMLSADPRTMRSVLGARIGVIWQDPLAALDPVMRVGDQIAEVIRAHEKVSRKRASLRARELMREVELPDVNRLARRYPHELSGGQRQRVVIAAAIAAAPDLMLADEPTTALDVTVQDQVLGLLGRLREQFGVALVLISHDLAVVGEMCDRVAIMYSGRIVERGPTARVFEQPLHHYSAGLLAASPDIGKVGLRPQGIAGLPPGHVAESSCAFAPRCAFADERCHTELPLLEQIDGRPVACHHPARPAAAPSVAVLAETGVVTVKESADD